MGYSQYVLPDGREAGYGVDAACEAPGCSQEIDRGLAFLCGNNPMSDETGCTHYFCYEHLFMGGPHQMCGPCFDKWAAADEGDSEGIRVVIDS
jgi:hypothetical protein